jgi:hypothetical protein
MVTLRSAMQNMNDDNTPNFTNKRADNSQVSTGGAINFIQKEPSANIILVTQEALQNLWHLKKYLDLYISLLEGSLSEDEFEEEARNFVVKRRQLKDVELQFSVHYLKQVLPDIDIDDISELLNVDFIQLAGLIEDNK